MRGTSSPESRANQKPTVTVRGDTTRSARVGQPVDLAVLVEDDGIPKTDHPDAISKARLLDAPSRVTVGKTNGLFMSWNKYRGPAGNVSFDPPQVKVWEDTRTSANSPWSALWLPPAKPEDGIYHTTVTFDAPGEYILWGRADDGGLYEDAYVTVVVTE